MFWQIKICFIGIKLSYPLFSQRTWWIKLQYSMLQKTPLRIKKNFPSFIHFWDVYKYWTDMFKRLLCFTSSEKKNDKIMNYNQSSIMNKPTTISWTTPSSLVEYWEKDLTSLEIYNPRIFSSPTYKIKKTHR